LKFKFIPVQTIIFGADRTRGKMRAVEIQQLNF
jgi:hypothetical protein